MYSLNDVLPDPNYGINDAGFSGAEYYGQPFSKVSVSQSKVSSRFRTLKGIVGELGDAYPMWKIKIDYNPMTREQFSPVYNFILTRGGGYRPFFVILPQYRLPKNTDFATFVQTNPNINFSGSPQAGTTNAEISVSDWAANDYSTTGLPRPGDMFSIEDNKDTLHTKVYQVARVETRNDYLTGNQPASGSIRLHFSPGLQKTPQTGAKLQFFEPKFRMALAKDLIEYSLNTEGLYSFGLELKEATY